MIENSPVTLYLSVVFSAKKGFISQAFRERYFNNFQGSTNTALVSITTATRYCFANRLSFDNLRPFSMVDLTPPTFAANKLAKICTLAVRLYNYSKECSHQFDSFSVAAYEA